VESAETQEAIDFRKEARQFLDAHAPAKDGPDDFNAKYHAGLMSEDDFVVECKRWQATLAEHGWACIAWPKEHGGRGGTPAEARIFAEEQFKYGVSHEVLGLGLGLAGPTILAHGTPEQQARFLPSIANGAAVWCQLFSEPGAGSDLAGLSTRAELDGEEWIVNGQKVWTTFGHHADYGILLARTDPSVPKHRGISFLLCDMHDPGVEVRPIRQIDGEAHFNEVFLTDVRIPAGNLVGGLNDGWRAAMTTLANERMSTGEGFGGTISSDDLIALARLAGKAQDPVVRQGLARLYTTFELLRIMGLRVRANAMRGIMPTVEPNIMKLMSGLNVKDACDFAMRVLPAAGLINGEPDLADDVWQNQFLYAPCLRIAAGSDEVQRNIIGERGLGLPSEPRVDRNVPFNQTLRA
jgi:alkylation response protein AidB-like acyl-CoA dehydrogenase